MQKYLADRGVCSRRKAESLILAGRVTVNGVAVTVLGSKVDPNTDQVAVDQEMVSATQKLRYLLLYKPTGYICSVKDERGRRTVLDLLPEVKERVYPVGRLDYDTSGLLLLTNDGDLTACLLHPSYEVNKTYRAVVKGCPTVQALNKLKQGIRLQDGLTAPAKVKLLRREENALIELTIHEGRNRQVRRMLEAVGYPVLHLKRVRFAFLDLTGLHPGEWRDLTAAEIQQLKRISAGQEEPGIQKS